MKLRNAFFMLIIGATAVGTITAAASTPDAERLYQINQNGQTFGYVNPYLVESPQDYPQLIAAIGIDGTEGYVYADDLDEEQPSNPEEAVKYMENLEQEKNRAERLNEEYLRYIPLYDSDGTTVIGEFGISFPFYGSNELN